MASGSEHGEKYFPQQKPERLAVDFSVPVRGELCFGAEPEQVYTKNYHQMLRASAV